MTPYIRGAYIIRNPSIITLIVYTTRCSSFRFDSMYDDAVGFVQEWTEIRKGDEGERDRTKHVKMGNLRPSVISTQESA